MSRYGTRRKLTRKEQRNLDIEIGFMEGVVRRDPKDIDAWKVLSDDYARRGKLEEGLKVDEQLARISPDDPKILYNLACGYSMAKELKESLKVLSKAIARGYNDFKWMLKDPELSNLRADPMFKRLLKRVGQFTTNQ